ncbi:hypothetical protein BJ998_008724 [Kutzneria kofuensis]|uniref:HTH lysR-type domain-containing protein n=1 Tax=Kutzneria kofuensis TaxID=103725 RepID=A0A7W9KRM9_9PSEU|nr:hypothetical protein [Kutzneria kofuensis]
MDARQLEYFLAVVDHGGMGRAAAALHVAQPSLSQALRTLERDLGQPLFHRIGRRLVLNDAGLAVGRLGGVGGAERRAGARPGTGGPSAHLPRHPAGRAEPGGRGLHGERVIGNAYQAGWNPVLDRTSEPVL